VTSKNVAEPRPIEVGPTTGGLTIITLGLSAGERVVTGGQYKLKRNAPVTIASPSLPAAGHTE
jgi:multidrug efflux system membrane fusion protein